MAKTYNRKLKNKWKKKVIPQLHNNNIEYKPEFVTDFCDYCGHETKCIKAPIYMGMGHKKVIGYRMMCENCSSGWPPEAGI